MGFKADTSFLEKLTMGATATRTVAIALTDADDRKGPFLQHNEPVWRDGARVGHVTSGAWGWRLGRSLGLASLHRQGGVTKAWLEAGGFEVQVAGVRYAADVQLAPFYDPAGLRMRG